MDVQTIPGNLPKISLTSSTLCKDRNPFFAHASPSLSFPPSCTEYCIIYEKINNPARTI
jgi:hypothetical protein